jgi:cytochrome c peroxidase
MEISKLEIVRWSKFRAAWIAAGSALIVLLLLTSWWLHKQQKHSEMRHGQSEIAKIKEHSGVVQPLPERIELNQDKVILGERLFQEVRLSGDNSISCFSCHDLGKGGVDRRARSIGVNGAEGNINAPTVFNSGFNYVQFWDGRAATLEEQIDGPVNNPKEMAASWPQVIAKLYGDESYQQQFSKLYRDGITAANIKDAIATFERSLVTPNSRFDKFLRGDQSALSEQEKNGFALFKSYGCSSCHQGMNLGGNMFEKMGLMGDYFADRGNLTEADKGRFNVNHDAHSLHEFRVPSLRNVARTAPYFHDGNTPTLREAVVIMARYQLGRPIPQNDIEAICKFLESLTGEYKGQAL